MLKSYLSRAEKIRPIIKRSVMIHGRKTSVSLEEQFWRSLRMIASERKATAGALIGEIDSAREQGRNLSSAIRTFVLAYYVSRDERCAPAGEGNVTLERGEATSPDQFVGL